MRRGPHWHAGHNSHFGGQFRANVAVKITYSAVFSLYFSLFLTGEEFARDCLLRHRDESLETLNLATP
jgi:hypothetical protein